MFKSFEIKTYPQLQFALGLINALCASILVIVVYIVMLTQEHVAAIDSLFSKVSANKFLASLPFLSLFLVLSGVWGWLSTIMFRLHDRVHEPIVRKWRAIYDADFILRALCAQYTWFPQELFDKAYTDKHVRRKFMQRLFYNFIGDEANTGLGKRMFFYTCMWKYWTLSIIDLYALFFVSVGLGYHFYTSTHPNPLVILITIIIMVVARIFQNPILDEAHAITVEQIAHIKSKQAQEHKKAAQEIVKDFYGGSNHDPIYSAT